MSKPGAPKPDDAPSVAMANFTDREPQQELFRRLIEAGVDTPLPVLMFHGVGGIGKTWLLRRFQKSIPEGLPVATIDFSDGERFCIDSTQTLATIRHEFDISCPNFDLAYAMLRYMQSAGDDPALKRTGRAGKAADAVVSSLTSAIPGGPLIEFLINQGGELVSPKLKRTALYERLAFGNGESDLARLRHQKDWEIEAVLLTLLAEDLKAHLPKREQHACRGVVLFDTYEALNGAPVVEGKQEGHRLLPGRSARAHRNPTAAGLGRNDRKRRDRSQRPGRIRPRPRMLDARGARLSPRRARRISSPNGGMDRRPAGSVAAPTIDPPTRAAAVKPA